MKLIVWYNQVAIEIAVNWEVHAHGRSLPATQALRLSIAVLNTLLVPESLETTERATHTVKVRKQMRQPLLGVTC